MYFFFFYTEIVEKTNEERCDQHQFHGRFAGFDGGEEEQETKDYGIGEQFFIHKLERQQAEQRTAEILWRRSKLLDIYDRRGGRHRCWNIEKKVIQHSVFLSPEIL